MTEEEFEEWITAQERGDRAKIAQLRRLLIIKKLGIDTVSTGSTVYVCVYVCVCVCVHACLHTDMS